MPRVELQDQLDIIKSIKAKGGYAKKWSSPGFNAGVPDIIGAFRPWGGLFLMEVKSVNAVDKHVFAVTPKQSYELTSFFDAGGATFLGVVVRDGHPRVQKTLRIYGWLKRSLSLDDSPAWIWSWRDGIYQENNKEISDGTGR